MTGEYFILEAEKSSELVTAFRLLAETGSDGQPRFTPDACRAVERAITCRNYASTILELCHLTRAASTYRGGYIELFWAAGPMRARRLRDLFAACRAPAEHGLRVGATGVELAYPDGKFSIAYSRMPVLVALAEFAVTALGFAELDEILAPLGERTVPRAQVSQQANALSRAVYDYLKDHLPTLQTQRKLAAVIEFLSERNGGNFDAAMIDDDAVLEFWSRAIDDTKAHDFRTFTSVFLAFARFRQVFDHAETINAIELAAPIGSSVEDGEVDPANIVTAMDIVAHDVNPLDELQAPPASRIKFFNAKERERVSFLFQCGKAADALPLSFVRCEVFGGMQSQISQALRTGSSATILQKLIAEGPDGDYRNHQQHLRESAAQGRDALLAAAYVMHTAGLHQAAELARCLCPSLNVRGMAFAETVASIQPALAEHDPAVASAAPRPNEFDVFLADARKAAKHMARQGFRTDEIHDEDVKAGFIAGCPLVAKILERVETFIDRLNRLRLPGNDWDTQFRTDGTLFAAGFLKIYGTVP